MCCVITRYPYHYSISQLFYRMGRFSWLEAANLNSKKPVKFTDSIFKLNNLSWWLRWKCLDRHMAYAYWEIIFIWLAGLQITTKWRPAVRGLIGLTKECRSWKAWIMLLHRCVAHHSITNISLNLEASVKIINSVLILKGMIASKIIGSLSTLKLDPTRILWALLSIQLLLACKSMLPIF